MSEKDLYSMENLYSDHVLMHLKDDVWCLLCFEVYWAIDLAMMQSNDDIKAVLCTPYGKASQLVSGYQFCLDYTSQRNDRDMI